VTNGVATKYYYFGKQRVALRVGTNPVTYLHTDHLGSTSATSGASVSSQNYYAFGNIRSTTGTVPTDFGFTGHRRDASAGLMYFGARYYDTAMGRFLGPDTQLPAPLTPQSLNRYSYVGNNPLRYTDPNGHCWPVCTVIAGAAIGAIIGGASVALPQMIENVQRGEPLTANIDPGEVARAAAVGAVAGAVGGATFGVGTAVLGTGLAATVATGAISGAVAGQSAIATDNVLRGQNVTEGLGRPEDLVRDAAIGGALSGVGYGIGKAIRGAGTSNAEIAIRLSGDTDRLSPTQLKMLQEVLKENKINLKNIEIVYAAEMPSDTAGMTLGMDAFALGPQAFSSKRLLLESILHELDHLKQRGLLRDPGAYGQQFEDLARLAEQLRDVEP
jgi:RHS repeat-associated protein